MKQVNVFEKAGAFAENKDIARDIRIQDIVHALENKEKIILNFDRVDSATQSFIHALISDALREYGNDALDSVIFKSCNKNIKEVVNIVVDYMQEGMG